MEYPAKSALIHEGGGASGTDMFGDGRSGFGARLRALREAARETQFELAVALGVRQQSIWRWEKGHSEPHTETLGLLCAHYRVAPEWLLYGVESSADGGEAREHESLTAYLATGEGRALPDDAVRWLRGIRLDGEPSLFTWHHLAAAWKSQEGHT